MNNEIVVVMAYYKGRKYFKEQLDSIRTQSKLPDKLIIVNDSPEDKKESDFLHKFNFGFLLNVEIIDNQKNEGFNVSFYKGIKRAYSIGAKYIFISDQDDVWLPDKIKLQYEVLKNGADICNHYTQKLINGELSSINFANTAGHSLAFKTKPFLQDIDLLSKTKYTNLKETINAPYDAILAYIALINNLKWGIVDKVLVNHRLHNNTSHVITNGSLKQDFLNIFASIYGHDNSRYYLEQNTSYRGSTLDIFKYYRQVVNHYDLCDNITKLKHKLFNLIGIVYFSLTKSI